ncbi:MAG: hypothetical protein ACLQU4_05295 [Limisphaerales bacterium]
MTWIKRNLFFVISVVAGLALTGYCAWLLADSLNGNAAVTADYNTTSDSLKAVQEKSPYPDKDNIKAAKADQERVRLFLADFRKSFASFPAPPAKDEQGFQTYLGETLIRFRNGATNAGVELPPDYSFGFSGLIGRLTYPAGNIRPWMEELEEIDAILDILYHAKINYLGSLQRVPVSMDDSGTGDLLSATSVTNQTGVVTPYKITFRGFSTEIAAVMEGFARSSNCFIIQALAVGPDTSVQTQIYQPPPQEAPVMVRPQYRSPAQNPFGQYGPNRAGANRGVPAWARRPPPVVAAPVATGSAGAVTTPSVVTILSENPLTVIMSINVVKLKATEH